MPRYFEFEVGLQDIQPRIWRRFALAARLTFHHLHLAVQDSFGWQNRHRWEFRLASFQGRVLAGLPSQDEYEHPVPDGRKVKLASYFTGKSVTEWCEYVYDFGDEWVHEVKLIRSLSDRDSFTRVLLQGERAGPPEDCGGVVGYRRLMTLRQSRKRRPEDGAEMPALDPDWHPDTFDLSNVRKGFDR